MRRRSGGTGWRSREARGWCERVNPADMKAYEASDLYQKEFAPALQPFFVGEYKTYRSEVKYMQ
jgi:hypothetical protein